jgi:hypothetical protein
MHHAVVNGIVIIQHFLEMPYAFVTRFELALVVAVQDLRRGWVSRWVGGEYA